jgi:hypothetical protein
MEVLMRSIYTGLMMAAVAMASFAIGRATSGPAPGTALISGNVASVEAVRLQSNRHDLPEGRLDAAEPALAPTDHSSSFHAYLVFTDNH